MKLEKHLGGHCGITHVDIGALNMLKDLGVKTMYDVGCGPGGMISAAQKIGLDCVGIDGDHTLKYPSNVTVKIHDLTTGQIDVEERDACWSCEFLEHVEEKYLDNIFSVFCKTKTVICTASQTPGGHHHVNLKDRNYWIEEFNKRDFEYNVNLTQLLVEQTTMHHDFVKNTGMVFTKK